MAAICKLNARESELRAKSVKIKSHRNSSKYGRIDDRGIISAGNVPEGVVLFLFENRSQQHTPFFIYTPTGELVMHKQVSYVQVYTNIVLHGLKFYQSTRYSLLPLADEWQFKYSKTCTI